MGKTFKEIKRVNSTDIAIDDDKIWLIRPSFNGVVEIDRNTGKSGIVHYFDEYNEYNWFQSICKVGDVLVIFPSGLDKIELFDCEKKISNSIQIIEPSFCPLPYDKTLGFWNYYVDKNCVYIAGYTYPAIIKLDLKEYKTTYIDGWIKEISDYLIAREYNGYIGYGHIEKEGKIFFPLLCCNAVLEIDTNSLDYRIIFVEGIIDGFRTIKEDLSDNSVWIETVGGSIIKLDKNLKLQNIIRIPEKNGTHYWGEFWPAVIGKEKVFLYPMGAKTVYIIDKYTYEIYSSTAKDEYYKKNGWINLQLVKEYNNKIFMISFGDYKWRIVDADSGVIEKEAYYFMNNPTIKQEVTDCFKDKGAMQEDEDGLELMIGALL